ncbi:hypothetical protein Clacol_002779 [Clathrus columnatus]|uniref:MINDY deubiquitinase domain-containing protein n=1 Tax=Clathrus columnatus TaxID=1419009 RepID=A0AAV5A9H4_9AGAM|nr:hypothetical protein Clacol_002779 [Clathrus columnatus]
MTLVEETAGLEDIWYLKEIQWSHDPEVPKSTVKIVTQNFNGNILILRNHIRIEPYDRTTVSYEYLSNLVAEYLLTNVTDVDPSSALSILPITRRGMDLNPIFIDPRGFRPAGDGGELKLFQLVGIELFHGWLADLNTFEFDVLSRYGDYDSAVNALVFADHLTNGQLVFSGEDPGTTTVNAGVEWKEEVKQKVEDALVIREFLDRTSNQLSYAGGLRLFHLATALKPGALVALFRASHLSVLYKSPDPERPGLYALVTDQIFSQEPSVVWEHLEDVEGGASSFVDSNFVRSSPAGGDFAGRSAEAVRRDYDFVTIDADEALARQLQEEERYQAQEWERQQRQIGEQQQQQQGSPAQSLPSTNVPPIQTSTAKISTQEKKQCIIM